MDVLMGYVYQSTHLPVYPSTSLPVYQSTHLPASDGRPLRGRSAVPVVYRRFAVAARRLTLRLLRGAPFGDGKRCCHSFSLCGENVLPCIPLMGNDCRTSLLWVMKDDVGEIYLIFNF